MSVVITKPAPAPKRIDDYLYPSLGPADDWDKEMDVPDPKDPAMLAELDRLAHSKLEKSPEQNVEWMLAQYERNVAASKPQRWQGQERWQGRENEEMRLVRIMHPNRFIELLRRGGVDARIREERHGRLWLNDFTKHGRVGVTAWVKDREGKREVKTVTTLQDPCGPEYSIMRFNEYNVPTNEKYRGWRTALLTLILTGVVTEEEAERSFGPAIGEAACFYREQLKGIRRMRMGLQI
jgi:hypothetical protein